MSKLAIFYILLSTDASMMNVFNQADNIEKERMLKNAGIVNAEEVVNMDYVAMHNLLSDEISSKTGAWDSLNRNVSNSDNKNNIARLGLKKV